MLSLFFFFSHKLNWKVKSKKKIQWLLLILYQNSDLFKISGIQLQIIIKFGTANSIYSYYRLNIPFCHQLILNLKYGILNQLYPKIYIANKFLKNLIKIVKNSQQNFCEITQTLIIRNNLNSHNTLKIHAPLI